MSYKQRPTGGEDGAPATVASVLHRLAEKFRTHVAEWPSRFVRMQEEALRGLE
ncbi:hypothetical protein [Haloglomus salinum]|jgi:hypothetical protein|uniref:hypothetical protein n=1 Tax=Haloglomus salinum TaxID=2962673 RepID=UPI0020C9C2DF|nr:hypothetical protein [Haloglomus salinum]